MKNILNFALLFFGFILGATILTLTGLDVMTSFAIVLFVEIVLNLVAVKYPKGLTLALVCGKLSSSILASCNVPLQSGTADRAIIINLDDIESVTYGANDLVVEAITLKDTKVAYQIDGINNSIRPTATLVQLTFKKMFDHMVQMIGFDISPTVKKSLTEGLEGRYVIITENLFKGTAGNSAFEIYGLTVGLELTVLSKDPNNQDTQGGFDFTFATNKNKEPRMPLTFFDTDYATTKALLDDLFVV